MSSPPPWPLLRSTTALETRVFRVSEDLARSPRTAEEHVFHRIEAPDWVNVVPVTAAGDVVLVRQYRHGSRASTLEIPGGMVDPGETPAEAAARELLEETGYGGGTISRLGTVQPNPALFGNHCHSFLARGVARIAEPRNDGAEDTRVEMVHGDRLESLVQGGDIDHALVIAALFWYERRLRGYRPPGPGDVEGEERS